MNKILFLLFTSSFAVNLSYSVECSKYSKKQVATLLKKLEKDKTRYNSRTSDLALSKFQDDLARLFEVQIDNVQYEINHGDDSYLNGAMTVFFDSNRFTDNKNAATFTFNLEAVSTEPLAFNFIDCDKF